MKCLQIWKWRRSYSRLRFCCLSSTAFCWFPCFALLQSFLTQVYSEWSHSVPSAHLFTIRTELSAPLKSLYSSNPASPLLTLLPLLSLVCFMWVSSGHLLCRPPEPSYSHWHPSISLSVLYFSCHCVIGFSLSLFSFILKEKIQWRDIESINSSLFWKIHTPDTGVNCHEGNRGGWVAYSGNDSQGRIIKGKQGKLMKVGGFQERNTLLSSHSHLGMSTVRLSKPHCERCWCITKESWRCRPFLLCICAGNALVLWSLIMCLCKSASKGQTRVSGPLELEL